ncbi:MAG: lytic transglycosylase domain-containing protein [Candidatus Eremiobacteraeota bacterium]|nr:lytic transglycosylase domain-containing protein [Candidatus Eremiobacteraeota bacterium]
MDITSDIAAVQARIAEITGASAPPPVPLAVPDSESGAGSGASFSQMVKQALGSPASGGGAPVPSAQIESLVGANAAAWQVDPALVKAIIANESGFDPNATSSTGAQGLMQLEPGTATDLGIDNAYDPVQNIWGGTRYIRGLLDRFHGDMQKAVAAYNAGPAAVEQYGGVPPYAETQNYVNNVLASYQKYKQQP